MPAPGQRLAKAIGSPFPVEEGHGAQGEIVGLKVAEGEPLFPRLFGRQPGVGHSLQMGEQRGDLGCGDHGEGDPFPVHAPPRIAHAPSGAPLQGEVGQRDPRLLAELEQGEAEFQVDVEVFAAHLVEDRPAGVTAAELLEAPGELADLLARTHRIAHGDHAASLRSVHEKGGPRRIEEQVLVAEHRQPGRAVRRPGDDLPGRLPFLPIRQLRLGGRRSQQLGHRHAAGENQHRHHRPHEAGRIPVPGEAPPQLVRILHVPVGEQAEPDRAGQHQGDGRHPSPGETLAEKGSPAVKMTPAGEQRRQHDGEDDRFLVVAPFEQGEKTAGGEQQRRQVVGDIEASLQAPGEKEQARPGQAAEEVGELHHRQRKKMLEPVQPGLDLRGCSRVEQDNASDQHQQSETLRHQEGEPSGQQTGIAKDPFPAAQHFVGDEQDRRHQQGDQIIDHPVDHQGAEEAGRGDLRDQHYHHRLENADSAGDVADQGKGLRGEKQSEKGGKREVCSGREQHVENRARQGPIESPQNELGKGQGERGHGNGPAPQLPRLTAQRAHPQIGGDEQDDDPPHRPQGGDPGSSEPHQGRRRRKENRPGDGKNPKPEGGYRKSDDPTDLPRRQSPDGIEPKPHRPAAEKRQADVVAEGVAEKGGKGHLLPGKRTAEVAYPEPIVTGHDQVTENRQKSGQPLLTQGDPVKVAQDVAEMVELERMMENGDRDAEQRQTEQ